MQQLLPRASFEGRYGYRPVRSLSGMGDAASQSFDLQATGMATSTAAAALPALVSAGWIASAAVPFIGAGIAVAASLAQYLIKNSGCGQTCIETSQWANQAAAALQQAMDAYFHNGDLSQPRTRSEQALFVQTFNQVWGRLVQLCSDPSTGDAGKRCISDRQRGACTWKQAYVPVYPGEPALGTCWNWFNGYLDVVANDAGVVDDSLVASVSNAASSAGTAISSALSSAGTALSGVSPIVLLGGAALVIALMMGDN